MEGYWMRADRRVIHVLTVIVLCLLGATSVQHSIRVAAQGQASLVGRAVLPAETLTNGPKAGSALGQNPIGGLKLPFNGQPVGSFSGIFPGAYRNTWFALTNGVFNSPQNSGDYLLRIYTVEVDMFTGRGGSGSVRVLDSLDLTDPERKAGKNIKNGASSGRQLTGADFNPRAFYQAGDGSFWIAESSGPSLMHFNGRGQLLDTPIPLDGAVQGLSALPQDGTLVVALRPGNGGTVMFRTFDAGAKAVSGEIGSYPLTVGASVSEAIMIGARQAVVIEQDGQQNQGAKLKRIFLADFGANPANKTLLADLLNIADPSNISTAQVFNQPDNAFGLGATFKFPFADVSAVYPRNAQTLVVVNNNDVPFGAGRSSGEADDTEWIAIQIGQPLNFEQGFRTLP
jgi:hypothetical protein